MLCCGDTSLSKHQRAATGEIRAGELVLDLEGHRIFRGDVEIKLTSTEFRLLHYLAMNIGQTVSYSRPLDRAWGYEADVTSNPLRSHVASLRRKLGLPSPWSRQHDRQAGARLLPGQVLSTAPPA